MTQRWRKVASVSIVLLVGLGLASCGGDDDDGTVASGNGGKPTTTATDDMSTHSTMGDDAGHGDAPDENPCAEGGSGEFPGMEMKTPEDDAKPITITATEYAFEGTDALEAGGHFAVNFENHGKELHELHVARVDDGEERSMEELFQDPNGEDATTEVGHAFACPGGVAESAGVDMSEPGRYLVVCFMPTGLTPETDPADFAKLGPPHAKNGMAVEVDVT